MGITHSTYTIFTEDLVRKPGGHLGILDVYVKMILKKGSYGNYMKVK
jgi:hypothetical protein